MLKRLIDLCAAVIGLFAMSPVLALIAIAIRLESRGSVIFKQTRVGKGGSTFQILKFRSMRSSMSGPSVTSAGDPRITRVGRLIRSSKLDELPQLINVVRGEMSLVGPRPEVPEYVAHWPAADRAIILSVRPGITDPASLVFRREAEILAVQENPERYYISQVLPQKVALYRQYVEGNTTVGDLRILVGTLRRTLGG